MRRTRIVGGGVVLSCVLGVLGVLSASSAAATLPELGRCVKVPVAETGEFTRENCVAVSKTHTGNYEWAPGPGVSKGFKETLHHPVLETVTGSRLGCTVAFLTGEFTGPKSEKITAVTVQGCSPLQGPPLACYTNVAEPGTIESTTPLKGELGFIPGSKTAVPWAGWDLKAESESSPILEFFCGENKSPPVYKVSIEGSVIGHVVKTNKMQTAFALKLLQSAGKQIPEAFIGGPKDTLTEVITPILNPGGETTEQAGLSAAGEILPEEALEIKVKV